MKVLLVNTYDQGGAAKACIRLHKGLMQKGIHSSLLFLKQSSSEIIENSYTYIPPISLRTFSEKVLNKLNIRTQTDIRNQEKKLIQSYIPEKIEWFSFADSGMDITTHPLYNEADVVNLHWVADFIDFSFFRKNKKPVVWTIHDMNPFTGGCHYAGDCINFFNGCNFCPQLDVCGTNTYSKYNYRYKQKYLANAGNLAVISPSQWLKEISMKSPLLSKHPHYCIPNGKDSSVFLLHDRETARKMLDMPINKKIILFVSGSLQTKRKGYDILQKAIEKIEREDVIVCSAGGRHGKDAYHTRVMELGHIDDENKMSWVYSAADLFVIPSIEDNLPNTVIESLLCGTPVVGFRTGGIPDMIEPGINGYLTDSITPASLSASIQKALNGLNIFDRKNIRNRAVAKYDVSIQADSYISLYEKIRLLPGKH